jgi:hydrogenase maturation protease
MKPRMRIVGIGTVHGDDAVGPEAIRRLQEQRPPDVAIDYHLLDSPQRLIDLIEDTDALIVIDGFQSTGGKPGTIYSLVWPDAQLASLRTTSTHGLGIIQALQLADALGQSSRRIEIHGIEIDRAGPGDSMSPAVAASLPSLVRAVRDSIGSIMA